MTRLSGTTTDRSGRGSVLVRGALLAFAGISAVVLAGACGGSDLDACRHYMEVICERDATCSPNYFDILEYEDPGTCVERKSLLCPALVALPNLNFKSAAISQCADDLAQSSCPQYAAAYPASCVTAFRGTLQAGDPCVNDFQCSSSTCVVARTETNAFACGTCAALLEAGDACSDRKGVCDTGLHCAGHVCTASKLLGENCENVEDCDVGLACLDGACAAPRAVGDLCNNDHECSVSPQGRTDQVKPAVGDIEYCDPESQTCQPFYSSYWRGLCYTPNPQYLNYCRAGFYCDINFNQASREGHCEPQLAEGDTCAGAIFDPCFPPATCSAGTCQLSAVAVCAP